jgi:arginine metabolism regulation protein II
MSAELTDSLGRRTAASLLADIDSACERLNAQDDGSSLVKGPFGVFQSVEEPMALTLDTIECSPDTNTDNTSGSMYPETDGLIEEIQRSDWPDHLPGDDLDIFTASLDSTFGLNHDDETIPDQIQMHDPSMANFFIDDPTAAEGLAIFSPGFISQVIGYDASADTEENLNPALRHPMSEMVPYPRDIPHSHPGLPEEAEPLLRHYRQTMAGQRSTMRAKRKSPWEIIFLPCALETFAELSLWNEASHTRSSIFYTLLAHSALQLHMAQKPNALSTSWKEIGLRNHERAQSHLRQALQHEMFGPKQASYKELLMAILAMAMTSVRPLLPIS